MFFSFLGLWLIAYLYLLSFTVRYVKRKNGSNIMAFFAVFGVLIITFGSEIFNSWYHKQVLCKREEVGLHIFERVPLPAIYTNPETGKSEVPQVEDPFFSRFLLLKLQTNEGFFPLTSHSKIERVFIERETHKILARYVNYFPTAGFWWLKPLDWFGENSLVGWIRNRGNSPGCVGSAKQYSLEIISSYFYEINKGDEK